MKKLLDRRSILQAGAIAAAAGVGSWVKGWPNDGAEGAQAPAQAVSPVPDEILNPIEVSGPEAEPVMGELPGARRLYVLPDGKGEYHLIGSQVMTRISRPIETGNTYELATFAGVTGSAMPRHTHLASHTAILVMGGDVEVELNGQRWRMLRGDFANIPAGTPHSWTMRSDRGRIALFSMGDRVGAAYVAMGTPATSPTPPQGNAVPISGDKLATAAMAGDFQLSPVPASLPDVVRVSNLVLPAGTGPYVLLDGGGDRYGANTFCAKDANTNGQFLFIMSEGGPSFGVGPHFHARHTEDFFALDGETMVWAYGKAVPLKEGDFVQAPPRNMHGFKMMSPYNRFVGFLTPGIFENFFTRGQEGRNGVGGRAAGEGSATPDAGMFGGGARGGGGFPGGGGPGARGGAGFPGGGFPGGGFPGAGGANGRGPGGPSGAGAPGNAIFRFLSNSAVGPDGYPLDVHGATMPLPPQDPFWTAGNKTSGLDEQLLLREHGLILCGGAAASREISPELRRALRFKPKAEKFV